MTPEEIIQFLDEEIYNDNAGGMTPQAKAIWEELQPKIKKALENQYHVELLQKSMLVKSFNELQQKLIDDNLELLRLKANQHTDECRKAEKTIIDLVKSTEALHDQLRDERAKYKALTFDFEDLAKTHNNVKESARGHYQQLQQAQAKLDQCVKQLSSVLDELDFSQAKLDKIKDLIDEYDCSQFGDVWLREKLHSILKVSNP